jgi:hypothetical protein
MRRALALGGVAVLLGTGGALCCRSRLEPPVPTPAELQRLRDERRALQDRFRALTTQGDRALSEAPAAALVIGVPTDFIRSLVGQTVTGLMRETTLTLRNLKVHHEDDVSATFLFARRKIGNFILDVDIHKVQGLLRPEAPQMVFGPLQQIGLGLALRVVDGGGSAAIRFQWDGKGVVGAVCGNLDVTREVTGRVVPAEYKIEGRFEISTDGGAILLAPRFGDVVVTVQVEPTEQAWQTVDQLIDEQGGLCQAALRKMNVREKLSAVLERGFNVKLPQKLFRPIRLPAGIAQTLSVRGLTFSLHVRPIDLTMTSQRLWYGADVGIEREKEGEAAAGASLLGR